MAKSNLIQLQVDNGETRHFVEMIGRFLFNFGLLEALSIWYIGNFATDEILVHQATTFQLRQRVDLVRQMVNRFPLPKTKKKDLDGLWADVLRLLEDRNHLAHNPLMFGWKGKVSGPPDFIGVPNFRKLKGYGDQPVPLMTFAQLRKKVDESSSTAAQLHEILDELLEQRSSSN